MKIKAFFNKKALLVFIILIAFAGSTGSSYYFYTLYQKSQKLLQNPTEAAKEETKAVLARVGKMLDLPTDEDPSIATIIDSEKLKDQPFFAKAKNGDKVIIYTNARRAILYRPQENKILDVAPLNIGTQSAAMQQTPPVRIALYNGTETAGLTNTVEKNLKAKYVDIEVVAKENAKKKDYTKTLVIDLTGSKKETAVALARELVGEVGNFPTEEATPSSSSGGPVDLLVIVGKEYSK